MAVDPQARYQSKLARFANRIPPLLHAIHACQHSAGLAARPILVSRYFKRAGVRKLQIGANVCALPGWLNSDLYPRTIRSITLDAAKRFPFADSSFDYVFSEHQFEHVGYEDGLAMLRECRRILRPGGKIRIATPSLDRLIALAQPELSAEQRRYMDAVANDSSLPAPAPAATSCFAINRTFMNFGHRIIYDRQTLEMALRSAGFGNVRFFAPGESDDPNLTGLETRLTEMDVYETMVVQAER